MKDLIEYIANWLVDEPEAVRVEEHQRGNRVVVRLHVDEHDMGRVIGREGRVAGALRTLLQMSGSVRGRQTSLEIR